MERKRRTERYRQPAGAVRIPNSTAQPAPPIPEKKRNPSIHHATGYRPQEQKRRHMRRIALYWIVMVLLAAVFVYAALQVVTYFVHSHQAKQEEQMIHEMIAQSQESQEPIQTVSPTASPTVSPSLPPTADLDAGGTVPAAAAGYASSRFTAQEIAKPEILIQFNRALAINPDTIGQLDMGENISTYVVQRDNTYYLRHSFTGEYSFSGAVFLDVSCSIYPRSRNLILHGHNMQDGTAFGKLLRYEDIEYLNRYPFIEFSTLYEAARYIPFAVLYYSVDPEAEDYLDLYRINAMPDDEFSRFIIDVQHRSIYHLPVTVHKSDSILTVTTCASTDDDARFAILAVKHSP